MATPKKTEQTNKTRKRTTIEFWKDRPAVLLMALTVALAFVFVLVLPNFFHGETDIEQEAIDQVVAEPMFRHPISGLPIYEEMDLPQLFGVMIDNHAEAWPPSGIDQALLVYEAPVEAGISRMLAVFSEEQEVDVIGPVRSARPYYLDWNNELDALYVHVGGSNAALDLIASGGTFDLNQYWFGEYFWRSTQRFAPHNVYTSTELLQEYVDEREEVGRAPELLYGLWNFKEPALESEDAVGVEIDFWAPTYVAAWEFDVERRKYVRSQGGYAHETSEGEPILADNIVIAITDVEVIDSVGRRDVRTTGEGEGYVLQDGRLIAAIWKKPSATERLRFYNDQDEEIAMNPGITWIEIIPTEEDLTFTGLE